MGDAEPRGGHGVQTKGRPPNFDVDTDASDVGTASVATTVTSAALPTTATAATTRGGRGGEASSRLVTDAASRRGRGG